MNMSGFARVGAQRKNTAFQNAQKAAAQKTAAQKAGQKAGEGKTKPAVRTPAQRRDRLELQFTDVLSAEKEGYIEVGGKRFAVTGDMAAQIRAAYDEMHARNEAKMARAVAEANAKKAREQSEAMQSESKAMRQAMEIARRIAKGGRVPGQDEQFLLEYSQEMYMAAKLQGMLAKEHEKEDSVLEDEEEKAVGEEEDGEEATRATVEASVSDGEVTAVSVGEAPASSGEE